MSMLEAARNVIILLFMISAVCTAQGTLPPTAIDGYFQDWDARPVLANDPLGDRGVSGIDFRTLRADSDAEWVYISFSTEDVFLLQQDNPLKLYLDTDASDATGTRFAGIGAELVWNFAKREGEVRLGPSTTTVQHADIGYIPAPSMTSTRFEICFRRDATIAGRKLFPTDRIRVVLFAEEPGGDRMPDQDGGVTVELKNTPAPRVTERTLEAPETGSIRILSWNVEQNGLLNQARRPIFERVLRAVKPDVMCFQECFELSAGQVQSMVDATLSAPNGRHWRALKTDAGNVMVTHLDIESDWLIQPNYRESAYLLRTAEGRPLLVINAHLRCCNANEKRQQEADGVIAFLRDARTPGDRIDLEYGTPIIMTGDFNLVGDSRQLRTLLTGDIVDNATYGPDSAPDWNGSEWTELPAEHPVSLFTWTWYDKGSNFAPGKLDYVLYTKSAAEITQHLVLNTSEMSDAQLGRLGLQRDDAFAASDHMARVVDVIVKSPAGTGSLPPSVRPEFSAMYPQPARDVLHIGINGLAGTARLTLSDMLGRTTLFSAFAHKAEGNAEYILRLPMLPAGAYTLTATGLEGAATRRVLLH
jgi:endonuclease/exonuclease/phosphatase family metal-dependent hydrolase